MAEYNGRNKCSGWCNSGADCRKGCSCNPIGYTGRGMCQKLNNNREINSISYRSFEGDNYSNFYGKDAEKLDKLLGIALAIVGVGSYLAYKKYGGKGVLYLLGGLVAWYKIDGYMKDRKIANNPNALVTDLEKQQLEGAIIQLEDAPVRGARQVDNV